MIPPECSCEKLLPEDIKAAKYCWATGLFSRTVETRTPEEIRNEIRKEKFRKLRKTGKWE